MSDTYDMPEHGWTCFHCGETFTTPGSAREHFGPTPNAEPGCVIKVQPGGERGLLNALRKAENELAAYRNEDQALARELASMQSRHYDALMSAEEAGYARGLRDFMKVEQQRDMLLAPLERIAECYDQEGVATAVPYAKFSTTEIVKRWHAVRAALAKVGAGKTDKGYCAESTRLCECRRNGELSKHCAEMKVGELNKEHQQ